MDPRQQEDSTYLQRLAALKLIRENMFYANPAQYNSLNFLGDIPGAVRNVAPQFEEVLPSARIISSNPDVRKQQIRDAILRIKQSKQSKSELGKQILHNTATMGLGSIPIGFALSAALKMMGFRGLKSPTGKWRLPIDPVGQAKAFIKQPHFRNEVIHTGINDALIGAGIGAASGTVYPLLAHNTHISDKALYEAAKVMQEQPYITSMPVPEMLSVIKDRQAEKNNKILSKLRNIGLGAGIGAGIGALGAAVPALAKAPIMAARSAIARRPITQGIGKAVAESLKENVPGTAAFMGGMGGISGAFSNNIIDENQGSDQNKV